MYLWVQVYQLQQEKRKLQEDFAQLLKEREQLEERCTSYEHEKIQLGPRLEETKWEVNCTVVDILLSFTFIFLNTITIHIY